MSNIINTYLKIQKCTFQEYENSIKDINTLYFIIDELKVYIGSHEYMTANTAKEFEELLNNSILPEFQRMVKEYIDEQLKNIVLEEVNLPVDQTYNPESINAHSGIAVAEAVEIAIDSANAYTDRNKVYVSDEYHPTSGQAMSGIAVAEAISNIKIEKVFFYKKAELYSYSFEENKLYIVSLGYNSDFPYPQGAYYCINITGHKFLYPLYPSSEIYEFWMLPDGLQTKTHYTTITDVGNYYTTKTVEGALQEIGAKFGDIDTALDNIIAIQNSYIGGATE